MARKVIITCAATGSIPTPSMSRHLPVSAHEIADAAIGAAEAGAAVVYLHANNPRPIGLAGMTTSVAAAFSGDRASLRSAAD